MLLMFMAAGADTGIGAGAGAGCGGFGARLTAWKPDVAGSEGERVCSLDW